jgi:hypothetical protein
MKRTSPLYVAVGCLIGAVVTVAPSSAADVCTCRAPGKRVELGGTTCLQTPQGPRLARCVVDVNIMSWQILDIPCPVSEAPHFSRPSHTAAMSPATGFAAFDPR